MPKPFVFMVLLSIVICSLQGQSPFYSESLIKYDLKTHTTDKPIPFDRSFTLVIDKLSSKNVFKVLVFGVEYTNGNRVLIKNTFINCNPSRPITAAIKDLEIDFVPDSDTLQLFFPPLKPGVNFDIDIIFNLSKECIDVLFKVNAQISAGDLSAVNTFNQFYQCTYNRAGAKNYMSLTFADYQALYSGQLAGHYTSISTPGNFATIGSLTEDQIQAIDIGTSDYITDCKDCNLLEETFKRIKWVDILLGNQDISKIFMTDSDALTTIHTGNARMANISNSLKFFDSTLRRIDRVLSLGHDSIWVGSRSVSMDAVRTALEGIRTALRNNWVRLKTELDAIRAVINSTEGLKQDTSLVGSTVASDLKTAGGHVLFIDAGLSNIIAPGLTNKAVYIPKLYWGVSIYFRPIDKNTVVGN